MAEDPEQLRRRLEENPRDEGAFAGLRGIYVEGGHHVQLAELYEYRATYGSDGAESAKLFLRAAEAWLDQVGDADRAVTALTEALKKDPTARGAMDRLESLYHERGDMAALMQALEQQIEVLEGLGTASATAALRAHYNQQLGNIWAQTYDRQDQAVLYFKRAFELDPSNVMALYCAREIYQDLGNHETAAKLLDLEARAEVDGNRRIALYRELAHARAERLGDLEGAVVALKRALAIEPANADVMGELALLLLRRAPVGGGDNDRMRAADLLYQVADYTGGEMALGYCEAALDAWPEHEPALTLFEQSAHESGMLDLLADRYRRLLEPLAESPLLADIYRRAGTLACDMGQLDEAVGYYEGLMPLNDPDDREVLIDLYRQTGRQAELADALLAGSESAEPFQPGQEPALLDPEALPRLRELAELLRSQGRDDEAEAQMLEILGLDPGDPEALSYLERRFRTRKDWTGLYQLLVNAGKSQKLSAAARVVRLREAAGIAEERLDDPDGAVASYKLATVLDPDDVELPRQLERLLIAGERWEDLIDRIEADAARAETPEEKIEYLRRIADLHWARCEDFASASDTYRRLLELKPGDEGALEALDEIYVRESDWEGLIIVLRKRAKHAAAADDKVTFLNRLASLLHEHLEDAEEAFVTCREALKHVPDDDEALRRMEAIDTISGQWERLVETLRYRADVAEDDDAIEYLSRAATTTEKHLEDFELAASLWQQAEDLAPGDVLVLSAKARCLDALGRWEEALQVLHDLADVATESTERLEVRRRIALVLEGRGDRDEAVAAWLEVLEEAEDAEALEALVRHYEASSEHDKLVDVLRRLGAVLEEPEALSNVLLAEARVLAGPLDLPDEAIAALERLLEEVDTSSRDALMQLRRIHVDQGAYDKAAEAAELEIAATENAAAKTELLLTCAEWYRNELDDLAQAISANERVLEIDPYRTDVIAALEELFVAVEDWERLLQLTRARYKAATDDEQRRQLLIAGGEISERQLDDAERAWNWYRELFDEFGHLPDVLQIVEEAAQRHKLSRELIGVYGELAKAAQTDLEQAGWWKKIGILYADVEDYEKALEAVLRGFALDPDDRELLDVVDEYSLRTNAFERLASVYDALVERERVPEEQLVLRIRAARALLAEGGSASLGFEQLAQALDLDPTSDELLGELEVAADASGRWEELLGVYDLRREIAQSDGERIDLLLRAAQVVQEHQQDPDRAYDMVLRAVKIDPADEHVATRSLQVIDGMERLLAMRVRGRYWRQITDFYKSLVVEKEEEPDLQATYLEWIARAQEDFMQDTQAAFDTRKKATLICPGHQATLTALERLAQRLEAWDELSLHYKAALEVVLDRGAAVDLHRRRARVLCEELDRPSHAVEHYWQLTQIDPGDMETRQKLAEIYAETERWSDLMFLLEKELPAADTNRQREIQLEVASIWEEKLDNTYEALDAYRRVLGQWPDDATAQAAMERLQRPSRHSKELDDSELAELGLLEETDTPSFDFAPEPQLELEPESLDSDLLELDPDDLEPEELEPEELEPEELEPEELEPEELTRPELPAGAADEPPAESSPSSRPFFDEAPDGGTATAASTSAPPSATGTIEEVVEDLELDAEVAEVLQEAQGTDSLEVDVALLDMEPDEVAAAEDALDLGESSTDGLDVEEADDLDVEEADDLDVEEVDDLDVEEAEELAVDEEVSAALEEATELDDDEPAEEIDLAGMSDDSLEEDLEELDLDDLELEELDDDEEGASPPPPPRNTTKPPPLPPKK